MKLNAKSAEVELNPQMPEFVQNPYIFYQQIRQKLPIFKWENYGHWCFLNYDDVNSLLRDRRFGRQILHVASREELGWPEPEEHLKTFIAHEKHSLLELEPPVHTRLRGLINRAFLSRQVETLRPKIFSMCNKLIDEFEHNHTTNLLETYATPIPLMVICELLGAPLEMGKQFLAWSHDHVAMYMAKRDRAIEDRAVKAVMEFSEYIKTLIQEKTKNPTDDLLSILIRARDEKGSLSEEELITTAILVLNAGHEATVHSLGNAIKVLIEQQHKGQLEAPAIEELLRIDPPLHMFTRYALEDLEYKNIKFKKGELIGLMLGAANHDPYVFTEPALFNPNRQGSINLSFGAGIHFCVGAPLARLEMEIALNVLYKRLLHIKLNHKPIYKNIYHFHGLEELNVTW